MHHLVRGTVLPSELSAPDNVFLPKMTILSIALMALTAQWMGADGAALPLDSDEAVVEFLMTAEVVETKALTGSRNLPERLTLRKDGVEARAIFRTVDKKRKSARVGDVTIRDFHDGFVYECAAYRLSRLLGFDNVPPCVLRTIDGRAGSVQLWIEHATTEYQNRYDVDGPFAENRSPDEFRKMRVFDALIDNFDRHPGNVLIDARDRVWFIDHTRSFRLYTDAPLDNVASCEPALKAALTGLERGELRALGLSVRHVEAVWRRRGQLIDRLSCATSASASDGLPNPHEVATHHQVDGPAVEAVLRKSTLDR